MYGHFIVAKGLRESVLIWSHKLKMQVLSIRWVKIDLRFVLDILAVPHIRKSSYFVHFGKIIVFQLEKVRLRLGLKLETASGLFSLSLWDIVRTGG